MKIIFMVEEQSMKEMLDIILPKILPDDVESLIIPHNGKSDLQKSIPKKMRVWRSPGDKFIIIHDQHSNDCKSLKEDLKILCQNSRNDFLIRIVCVELESWYFGDLDAVSRAYDENFVPISLKRKYREPDRIANAKDELRKLVPTYQPISGAKKIAVHMNINNNTSKSFKMFVSGVKKMCRISR